MELSQATRARIEQLVSSSDVVLFMKGTRTMPRCGFSATVVQILDGIVDEYATVDVLADPEVREGIKAFSDWPTIPQLYVKGEFLGGADIAKEMAASGELQAKLGVSAAVSKEPIVVTVTPAAAAALVGAREQQPAGERFLRISVSAGFQHGLSFGPALPGDVSLASSGIDIRLDAASAKRAGGLVVDFVTSPQSGFKITNPNEPARVQQVSVQDLKKKLDAAAATGTSLHLFDARTPGERAKANIGGILLDDAGRAALEALPKDAPIYFHCHHGGRSQAAAEFYLKQGYQRVFNVAGGIDAWSLHVDSTVPRY
jgi:monothiol glutaredoxin